MRRSVSRLAAVVGILAAAAPIAAEESTAPSGSMVISQSAIARAVKTWEQANHRVKSIGLPNKARPPLRAQDTQVTGVTEARSFFASPKGILTLTVLGAGIGYATYSKVHDRIHTKNPDR